MNDDRTERENQRLGNLLDDAYSAAVGLRDGTGANPEILVDLCARLLDESCVGPWAREAEFAREEDVLTRADFLQGEQPVRPR